jgi:GWxTD domain-containing protein
MFFAICATSVAAREVQPELQISVVCFKGTVPDSERVDVYTSVPYSLVTFVQTGNTYTAEYSLQCVVKNSDGEKVLDNRTTRRVSELRYDVSRGSTGKSDILQTVCALEAGVYVVDVIVTDAMTRREYVASTRVRVLSFEPNIISLSSVLFATSMEQRGERFVMTPHVSDNVGMLDDGFFVFFETYNEEPLHDSVDLVCEILDRGKRAGRLLRRTIDVRKPRSQHFVRVQLPPGITNGSYVLRTVLVDTRCVNDADTTEYLARSERQIVVEQVLNGMVIDDLDKAIRRMRYVAAQSSIDSIRAGSTAAEKRKLFEEFWKALDPTPGTLRNEAFEEYYTRVQYTDKNFRSYNEGWLTDMGMVYIVLGPPTNSMRRVNNVDGSVVVEWFYALTNRRFVFLDFNGFGDFRLSTATPFSPLEKYTYTK